MLTDWREQLRRIRDRVTGVSTNDYVARQSARQGAPLAINLGIDFGTSFTKICYRDVGTEETGIVTLGERTLDSALIPSIVAVDQRGILSGGNWTHQSSAATGIKYLKMRLADLETRDVSRFINGVDHCCPN